MSKQKIYSIVGDMENFFHVQDNRTETFVYDAGSGKAGLEDCEEWIAKQPEE